MSREIVPGSLGSVMNSTGGGLADAFMDVAVVLLVDCSSSMTTRDSRGGLTREEVAREELALFQRMHPGQSALISFAGEPVLCPDGVPVPSRGSTNMLAALEYARIADVAGMRFIVISDGCADRPDETIRAAATYNGRIDAVYVGPEGDREGGERFLRRLVEANRKGGAIVVADRAKELAAALDMLLLTAPAS